MTKNEVSRLKKVAKSRVIAAIDGTGLVSNGFITSTNLETFITLKTDIRGEGIINLLDIEKAYSEAWIDGGFLHVKRNGSVVKSRVIDAENFPSIPKSETAEFFDFDQVKELKTVALFAGDDDLRPAMSGVYFADDEMVATDAHRMMWVNLKNKVEYSMIIPAIAVSVLSETNYKVMQVFDDKQRAFFVNDSETISFRMIDGQYPNYKAVIPAKDDEKVFSFSKSEMIAQIENALPIVPYHKAIAFRFTNGVIDVATQNIDTNTDYKGQINQVIAKGEKIDPEKEFMIAFNGKFLLAFLKIIQSATVTMHFTEINSAAIFDGNKLLMPITLKGKDIDKTKWFDEKPIKEEEKVVENQPEAETPVETIPENVTPEASPEENSPEETDLVEDAEIVEEFPTFEEEANQQPTAKSQEIWEADFERILNNSSKEEIEEAKTGCGLSAAKFAYRYGKPGTDNYYAAYNTYYNYFHNLKEADEVETPEVVCIEEEASQQLTAEIEPPTNQQINESTDQPSNEDPDSPAIFIVRDFTPKSFIVFGDIDAIAEQLEAAHGKFTRNLRVNSFTKADGYWFSSKRLEQVEKIIANS